MILKIYCIYVLLLGKVSSDVPQFRILAPEFVCPKDEDAVIDKPDDTVIMLQTASGEKLNTSWRVRWSPLPNPTQRVTLLLWRAIRYLEGALNGPQTEPNVFVIDNDQLLPGVDYVFTVTATVDGARGEPRSFHIDNSLGRRDLVDVEGRGGRFSVTLLGGERAAADAAYGLEAVVTTCHVDEDYHFNWTVTGADGRQVALGDVRGARLPLPSRTLAPAQTYDVNVKVIRSSTGEFLAQTGLPLRVYPRGLELWPGAERQRTRTAATTALRVLALNHDHYKDSPNFEWSCTVAGAACDFFSSENSDVINLFGGLPEPAEYEFKVKASVEGETASAKMTIIAVQSSVPVIELIPARRVFNEGSTISLTANATDVAPSCSLTWYFASEKYLATVTDYDTQHGEPLTETLTVFSLEENFLNELADYTNETEWRQVTAEAPARAGRARFVAECGCSLTNNCSSQGLAYADVAVRVNTAPAAGGVLVSPASGVALETQFRISTTAAEDPDLPLKYSFYCSLGDELTLLLGFYYEHLALETILPYIDGTTTVWVEACDALGACIAGPPTAVRVAGAGAAGAAGAGAGAGVLSDAAVAALRRCDLLLVQRIAVATLVTYENSGQSGAKASLAAALRGAGGAGGPGGVGGPGDAGDMGDAGGAGGEAVRCRDLDPGAFAQLEAMLLSVGVQL